MFSHTLLLEKYSENFKIVSKLYSNLCRASWTLALLFGFLVSVEARSPFRKIEGMIDSLPFLQTSEVGIVIYDLTADSTLFSHQADKLYRPASVEKLLTSVTALTLLGREHEYQTRLAYTGDIEGDTLKGDLYVVGDMDAEFMEEDMVQLAAAVAESGIRVIDGQLKGDVSLLDSVYWGPGWSWDDSPESFQPYLSPLMLNRGCINVTAEPTYLGNPAKITITPHSDIYKTDNRSVCFLPSRGNLKITRDWMHNNNTVLIKGNVSARRSAILNVFDSKDFFLRTLRYQLSEKGVTVSSDSLSYGSCPQDTIGLYTHSRNICEILKQALKESDNLCAESMFFHAARKYQERTNLSFKQGQKTIKHFIKTYLGHDERHYRIADGSGVSLYNYISPRLLVDCLRHAFHDPELFQPLYVSLPIAGVDGTLNYRMGKGKAFRNVRAKTGSVTGVSSLAGYVKAANGHMLSFAIINQNVLRMSDARRFQDQLCEIMASEIR